MSSASGIGTSTGVVLGRPSWTVCWRLLGEFLRSATSTLNLVKAGVCRREVSKIGNAVLFDTSAAPGIAWGTSGSAHLVSSWGRGTIVRMLEQTVEP